MWIFRNTLLSIKLKEEMSYWSKEQLEQMLEDVVNVLDLSDAAIAEHGQHGTPPAELVRMVLQEKDRTIRNLRAGMVDCSVSDGQEDWNMDSESNSPRRKYIGPQPKKAPFTDASGSY
jgi:hypothetical protein